MWCYDYALYKSTFYLLTYLPWPSVDIRGKFYFGDRPRGTPLVGELNTSEVANSDFGPIEGYIS